MATDKNKKKKDPVTEAYREAEKDIAKDAELSDPDPTDDLDEGELARRDNSDEEALDFMERPRHPKAHHADGEKDKGDHPSGKGKEK